MAMSENEAIQWLKHTKVYQYKCDNCEYIDINGACNEECKDFYDMAIQALSEIQQYRAIGTVKDFKNAVEIIRPRKPYKRNFGVFICSLCGEKVGQMVTKTNKADCMNFCANCGSLIDWSEWERSRHERSEKM